MKIDITKKELEAIILLKDDIEAMIGCGEDDSSWSNSVKIIYEMLERNNISNKKKK